MAARNGLILGSGRSGTSMLAGTLRGAGYYMGAHLLPADEANPRGYFEDDEINAINEALLAAVTPAYSEPAYGWRWLAAVPVGAEVPCPPGGRSCRTRCSSASFASRPGPRTASSRSVRAPTTFGGYQWILPALLRCGR